MFLTIGKVSLLTRKWTNLPVERKSHLQDTFYMNERAFIMSRVAGIFFQLSSHFPCLLSPLP